MICSILIPSRRRFDLLLRAVQSVIACAKGNDVEIIVRLHTDDKPSMERISELEAFQAVRVITGKTYDGYLSLNRFYNELEIAADGNWRWQINDDMVVKGEEWDSKLSSLSGDVLVHPGIHQLNETIYGNNPDGPAPIYPAGALQKCGIFPIPTGGPDTTIYEALVVKHGWGVRFLDGITIWHDWKGHEDHA